METIRHIAGLLDEVKARKPLVHHITNYVTVNDCANIVLALGAAPVMADDIGEVEEMVGIASCLVLNIGTLNERTIRSMLAAGKKANQRSIPVVLDPVGVGATQLRTETAERLIREVRMAVVRGNMSEIKVLAGLGGQTRGVDATEDSAGGREIAADLATRLECTVAITGVQDIVSDGSRIGLIDNGDALLAKVTGTGCMATSLIGCYAGVTPDYYLATCAGLISMGLTGEKAAETIIAERGMGTFRIKLFDAISNLTADAIIKGGKYSEC